MVRVIDFEQGLIVRNLIIWSSSIIWLHSGTHHGRVIYFFLVSLGVGILNVIVQTAKGCTRVVIQYGEILGSQGVWVKFYVKLVVM